MVGASVHMHVVVIRTWGWWSWGKGRAVDGLHGFFMAFVRNCVSGCCVWQREGGVTLSNIGKHREGLGSVAKDHV